MRKVNVFYVGALLTFSLLAGGFIYALGMSAAQAIFLHIVFSGMVFALAMMVGANAVLDNNRINAEDRLRKNGFEIDRYFYSPVAMLWIDNKAKRIALLPRYAPFRPQIVAGSALDFISVYTGATVYNKTKQVSFCFSAVGKAFAIPTFRSPRTAFALESEHVKTAIATANQYVGLLRSIK